MRLTWGRLAACLLGLLVGWSIVVRPAYAVEEEGHVLILNGVDPYLPAYLAIDSAMRANLAASSGRRVVLFSEALDGQRFAPEPLEPELISLLSKKYGKLRIDVVVAVTQPAVDFFSRHGAKLWPGARLVFHSIPRPSVEALKLPPDALGVVARRDFAGTVDIAGRLQPKARRILVVAGSAEVDVQLEGQAREVLASRASAVAVEFLSGWPLPDLLSRVAAEPADTIVLYLTQFRDRDGRPYIPANVQRAISGASAAPVYSPFETHIGSGAVAGSVESFDETGRLVGEQVRAALDGGPPFPGHAVREVPSRCLADARALQRWSLDQGRLPDGCEVRFADRPFWREYFWPILAVLGVVAGQSLLIAALLVQGRRRRMAEAESRKRFSEMAHMNRRVVLGEMSASIAHELNQPLGAIRNNAAAAEMLLKANPPRLQEVAEILGDIKRDDQRASDIIERIRKMLRNAEFEVRAIDLNATLGEALALLAEEAAVRGVTLASELDTGLAHVSADSVEVKQVVVNLALNAMEAMRDQPETQRRLVVRSRRANNAEAEVSVADSGVGITSELLPSVFEAFVTSKPSGMGLGLAISRTIVEAHGGRIRAENGPAGGAIVHFTLPFAAVPKS